MISGAYREACKGNCITSDIWDFCMILSSSCAADGIWPITSPNESVILPCSKMGYYIGEMSRICISGDQGAEWGPVNDSNCHSLGQLISIILIVFLCCGMIIFSIRQHNKRGTKTLPSKTIEDNSLL